MFIFSNCIRSNIKNISLFLCVFLGVFLSISINAAEIGILRFNSVEIGFPKIQELPPVPLDFLRKKKILRIEFTSDVDLQSLAESGEYEVYNYAGLCDENGVDLKRKFHSFPRVFDDAGQIGLSSDRAKVGKLSVDRKYHIYLFVSGIFGNGVKNEIYDLEKNPMNICLRVEGGNIIGGEFNSKTILISSDRVSAAILRGE